MHYYNEFDRKTAAWLRELMAEGLIPEGVVDERSIVDVQPADLVGFTQCHFFAGIGGWAYALRLAGWPEDKPVWTASCPCQPFSQAGKGLGTRDPRHLWPVLRRLVGRCKPPTVFGEQVASAAGRVWLAGVRANMARMGYALGASDLCAASVGAPQIRQRLYWVANATNQRTGRSSATIESGDESKNGISRQDCGSSGSVAHSNGGNPSAEGLQRSGQHGQRTKNSCAGSMADAESFGRQQQSMREPEGIQHKAPEQEKRLLATGGRSASIGSGSFGLGDTDGSRPQGHGQLERNSETGGGR